MGAPKLNHGHAPDVESNGLEWRNKTVNPDLKAANIADYRSGIFALPTNEAGGQTPELDFTKETRAKLRKIADLERPDTFASLGANLDWEAQFADTVGDQERVKVINTVRRTMESKLGKGVYAIDHVDETNAGLRTLGRHKNGQYGIAGFDHLEKTAQRIGGDVEMVATTLAEHEHLHAQIQRIDPDHHFEIEAQSQGLAHSDAHKSEERGVSLASGSWRYDAYEMYDSVAQKVCRTMGITSPEEMINIRTSSFRLDAFLKGKQEQRLEDAANNGTYPQEGRAA